MQIFIAFFILTVFLCSSNETKAADIENCLDIARVGIIAVREERLCKFKEDLHAKSLEWYDANGCGNIIEDSDLEKATAEITSGMGSELKEYGVEKFCTEVRANYIKRLASYKLQMQAFVAGKYSMSSATARASTKTTAAVTESCLALARSEMIADGQEALCSLKGDLKGKLKGLYEAEGCPNLVTQIDLDRASKEVLVGMKSEYEQSGKKTFCDDASASYIERQKSYKDQQKAFLSGKDSVASSKISTNQSLKHHSNVDEQPVNAEQIASPLEKIKSRPEPLSASPIASLSSFGTTVIRIFGAVVVAILSVIMRPFVWKFVVFLDEHGTSAQEKYRTSRLTRLYWNVVFTALITVGVPLFIVAGIFTALGFDFPGR